MAEKLTYTIKANELETNHIGVNEIMKFYAFAKNYSYRNIDLNVTMVNSIDANLSSLLLAIAHKLKVENKVSVFTVLPKHMNVFFRNGLVAHLSGKGNNNPYADNRDSTIPLTTFDTSEDDKFCEYLRKDFFSHRSLENLTTTVKRNLSTHFEEVFANVVQHSNTTCPMFTCGQYFPEKNILKFSLTDLGEGFLKKIAKKTGGEIATDNAAIVWSTYNLNTTKDINKFGPGGTGLKELKKYCEENNGSFHICSGHGYLNFLKGKTFEHTLTEPLQGAMVNLIFRNI